MENLNSIFGAIVATAILLAVIFPQFFLPPKRKDQKKVGSSYWGVYEGSPTEEPEDMKTIELNQPGRKTKTIAGSQVYSAGRSISFRQ